MATVTVQLDVEGATVAVATQVVEALAGNEWVRFPGNLAPLTLSTFVTPNAPAIQVLNSEAAQLLVERTRRLSWTGYDDEPAERTDEVVRAVFDALKARDIRYVLPPASWASRGQLVRSAQQVLESQSGTCLDTTVTMAAAFEQVGISPIVFVVTGHAFLGYWRVDGSLPEMVTMDAAEIRSRMDRGQIALVETTLVCNDGPDDADTPWDVVQSMDYLKYIATGEGFDFAVDVVAARTNANVPPMPVRSIDTSGAVTITEYHPNEIGQRSPLAPRDDAPGRAKSDVPARVQRWKNSLLDLSLRNKLINFGGRNDISLVLPASQLARLEDVVNSGERIVIRAHDQLNELQLARGARVAGDLYEDDLTSQLETQRTVFAEVTEASYLTRLRGLGYRARTIVQETGANNLYLAFGTLNWKLRDGRGIASPLILVPVQLEAVARGQQYRIHIDDAGESTPNCCLLEKLRQEYDLKIPALENPIGDDSGIDLEATFAATRDAIAKIDGSFTVDLSILQFAKFRLWKDLDDNWQELASNPLVNHLIHSPTTAFADEVVEPVGVDLDALGSISPVSADASQLQAVADAVAGKTFILEGPPGTGKSQTITNILSRAIADGKRVLFVAEKAEALKVVQKRLEAAGLSAFSLDVHDKSSKPAAVRAQLLAALDNVASVDSAALTVARNSLAASSRVLTRYAELVHEPNAAEFSLYSAHARELDEDATVTTLAVPADFVMACTEDQLTVLRDTFRGLPEAVGSQRLTPNSPWRFAPSIPASTNPTALGAAATDFDQQVDQLLALPALSRLVQAISEPSHLQTVSEYLRAPSISLKQADRALKPEWRSRVDTATDALTKFAEAPHPEMANATPAILTLDLAGIHAQALAADASSFFGRKRARRAVLAQLTPGLVPGAKLPLRQLSAIAGNFANLASAARSIREQLDAVKGLELPAGWNPLVLEHRAAVLERVVWLRWAADAFNADRSVEHAPIALALREQVESGEPLDAALAPVLTTSLTSFTTLIEICHSTGLDLQLWTGDKGFFGQWRATRQRRGTGDELQHTLHSWLRLLRHLDPLTAAGLNAARVAVMDGEVDPDYADISFAQGLARISVTERETATGLDDFDGVSHEKSISRYRSSLRAIRELLPDSIPVEILARRDFDTRSTSGRIGLLRRELERKRGGMSVRALLGTYSDVITSLTQCVMMSPESVARFFPAIPGLFDIAVFDEASQLRVADSIGAMGRARSVVVVGDSKQMPPTSFAESIGGGSAADDDDDATDVVEDQESILTECVQALVPRQMLSWHYRSQDESLIAFSNEHYYRGKLSSFPTPLFGTRDDGVDGHGVSFVRVNGEYQPAGHGKLSQTNEIEAKAVVADVVRRFKASPDAWPSVGVVTFNKNQRMQIDGLLRDTGDQRILDALEDDDGIFVKNIETVQGDERDVILFSVGRSAVKGAVPLNFGPLNQMGGERRFNVAVTRARRQVVVYCSFEPSELKAENSASEGLRNLRDYLDFAQRGSDHASATLSRQSNTDLHREEIAAALRERGYVVTTDVGLSDFRIDLTIARAGKPDRAIAAVLLDGPRWAQRATANDRDALPLDVLSDLMNWPSVNRVWTPEWLLRRDEVIERLVESIEQAAPGGKPAARAEAVEPVDVTDEVDDTSDLDDPIDVSSIDISTARIAVKVRQDALGEPWKPAHIGLAGDVSVLNGLPSGGSARRVNMVLAMIIQSEGPIHLSRLARVAAASFGLTKVNDARANAILRQVDPESVRVKGEPYAWPGSIDPQTWTSFRTATAADPRPIETINWREISNAMVALTRASRGMYEDELKREALGVFGGKRLTENIDAMLGDAIVRAVDDGRLERQADGLLTAPSSR